MYRYLQKVIQEILKVTGEKNRIRIHKSVVRIRGSDPFQDVTDPEQWFLHPFILLIIFTKFPVHNDIPFFYGN
jgi:hypothetical protein